MTSDPQTIRLAALYRLQHSRFPDVRGFARELVAVDDTAEHYRWLLSARISEIRAWAVPIIAGVRENRARNGGRA